MAHTIDSSMALIDAAKGRRKVGLTSCNQQSSRSHLFVRIEVSDGQHKGSSSRNLDTDNQVWKKKALPPSANCVS